MAEGSHKSFTDLQVWKIARALKKDVHVLVQSFPESEKYRLTDQLIRATRSITSCIAEGHGRFSFKEQIHFCMLARGSASETLNHLIDAFDCRYISEDTLKAFRIKICRLAQLLMDISTI